MLGTLFSHFGTPVAFIAEDKESYAVVKLGRLDKVVYVYKSALTPLTLDLANALYPDFEGAVFNGSDATHQHVFAEREVIRIKDGELGESTPLMFYRHNGGTAQVFHTVGNCMCEIMKGDFDKHLVPSHEYCNYVLKATLGVTI